MSCVCGRARTHERQLLGAKGHFLQGRQGSSCLAQGRAITRGDDHDQLLAALRCARGGGGGAGWRVCAGRAPALVICDPRAEQVTPHLGRRLQERQGRAVRQQFLLGGLDEQPGLLDAELRPDSGVQLRHRRLARVLEQLAGHAAAFVNEWQHHHTVHGLAGAEQDLQHGTRSVDLRGGGPRFRRAGWAPQR